MTFATNVEQSFGGFAPPGFQLFTLQTTNLRGRGDCIVYTPQALRRAELKGAPTVVLLHGACGSAWAWAFQGGAHQVLERLIARENLPPMILVMPSDGLRGGHIEREGNLELGIATGYFPTVHWNTESWIMDDVIPTMREHVLGFDAESLLFLGGLSMGGYGSLRLGAKYADQFTAISAHSSVCGLERALKVCGLTPDELTAPLNEYVPLELIKANQLKLPPLRFDCGSEDHLFLENQQFHHALLEAQINHKFNINPGAHTWKYWGKHLADSLRFFAEQLR
ncbi:MAG: alpha/beta hydrolase [Sumerlaeia bacterium]